MKKNRRGHIVLERSIYPFVQKMCTSAGWTTKRVLLSKSEFSDTALATKYGKNISILLTSDKTAYTNNVKNGFKGYIVQDIPVDKSCFVNFQNNMSTVLNTYTSKTLGGCQIVVGKSIKKSKIKII